MPVPVIVRLSVTALLAGFVLLLGAGSPAAPVAASWPVGMDAMSLDLDTFNTPANTATSLGSREPCARVIEDDILDGDEDAGPDQLVFDLTALNVGAGLQAMVAYSTRITYPAPQVKIVEKDNAGLLSTALGYFGLSLSDPVPDTDGNYIVHDEDLNGGGVSGSGFLVRLTLETNPGAAPGAYLIALADSSGYVGLTDNYQPGVLNHGMLVIGGGPLPDCTDGDGDGFPGGVDNCPAEPNPSQMDTDGDGAGDACDADDDGDLVYDTDEAACGSDPLLASRRPERIDGAFAGVDDDGDAAIDEALPAGAEAFDCDGDGYLGSEENNVYQPSTQGDQDPCGANSSPPTVPASPIGWPADLSASGSSLNRVTLVDVTSFVVPVRYFNTDVGTHFGDVRWDLKTGKGTFTYDINLNDLTGLIVRKPAMLGGVRSFKGPPCPWPP